MNAAYQSRFFHVEQSPFLQNRTQVKEQIRVSDLVYLVWMVFYFYFIFIQ